MTDKITIERNVLQQALDALEQWAHLLDYQYMSSREGMTAFQLADDAGQEAIKALTEAQQMAEPVTKAVQSNESAYQRGYMDGIAKPCTDCATNANSKQPAQKLVAWLVETEVGPMPWPASEYADALSYCAEDQRPQPLYKSQQPHRQPLTDDQIRALDTSEFWDDHTPSDFVRLIEQAHGIGKGPAA